MGLRMARNMEGAAQIQRADGTPASETEISLLRETIAREPAALQRQPDFYRQISRERFAQLKTDYHSRPEERERVFKDVVTSPGNRDFLWGRSCARVSGDCNPVAMTPSYSRNDFVHAKDLNGMAKALSKKERPKDETAREDELDKLLKSSEYTEEEEKEAQEFLAAQQRLEKAGKGLGAGFLKSVSDRIGAFFGGSGLAAAGPSSEASISGGDSKPGSWGGWSWGGKRAASPVEGRAPRRISPDGTVPAIVASPLELPASRRGIPLWMLLAAAAGAAIAFFGLIRAARGRD